MKNDPVIERALKWWTSLPDTSKFFTGAGIGWSFIVYLISALQMLSSGLTELWVVLTCIGILISGLLLCLLTSIHWFVYGWLSLRRPSSLFMLSAGLLMLVGDVYARTQAVFLSKSSTGPIAVLFIPIWIGGTILPVTYLVDWVVKKR